MKRKSIHWEPIHNKLSQYGKDITTKRLTSRLLFEGGERIVEEMKRVVTTCCEKKWFKQNNNCKTTSQKVL